MIFLHIGTHKTGSTAIQHALKATAGQLHREGIVVLNPPQVMRSLQHAKKYQSGRVEQIRKYLAAKILLPVAVMSNEGWSGNILQGYANARLIAKSLRAATAGQDVRIVVYFRRQDEFVESAYVQYVQQGECFEFGDFVQRFGKSAFDWHALCDAYAAEFGRENIIARSYDKRRLAKADSIVREFASIIGSNSLAGAKCHSMPNRSYSREAVAIAKHCNAHLPSEAKRELRKMLQRWSPKDYRRAHGFFSAEGRKQFLARYAKSNRRLEAEYFRWIFD